MYHFRIFKPWASVIDYRISTKHAPLAIEKQNNLITLDGQCHGNQVVIVDAALHKASAGDALITNRKHRALTIKIADCLSILIFDPIQHAIANIHAGWRGLSAGVISNAIEAMKKTFQSNPNNFIAGISPSIGPCCFTMNNPKQKASHALPQSMHAFILNGNRVDLWAAAEHQLQAAGIPQRQIENLKLCTVCNNDIFYSHRRGDTERFYTTIMLK